MPYNPWEHADQLGLRIIEGNPGKGNRGLWVGSHTIILKPGLTALQAQCTLSHEIVHAEYDPPLIPHHLSLKAEARADRIAALRLIPPDAYNELVRIYPDNPNQIAYELGVTPKLLATYASLTPKETPCHKLHPLTSYTSKNPAKRNGPGYSASSLHSYS